MQPRLIYDASWGKLRGEVYIVVPELTPVPPVNQEQVSIPITLPAPTRFHFPTITLPKISFPQIQLPSSITVELPIPAIQVSKGLLQGVGIGLMLLALFGVVTIAYPIVSSEVSYRLQALGKSVTKIASVDQNKALLIETQQKQFAQKLASEFGMENTDFSIYIPRIEAKARVVENVDATNEEAYKDALQYGVAHAAGTSVPGASGGTYIFSHSTNGLWNVERYNAVFYLLRELKPEDKDDVYVFYKNKVYKYKVAEKYIVEANDTSWITKAQEGPQRLILQTCWPPGTSWKRLVVVAYPDTENMLGQGL